MPFQTVWNLLKKSGRGDNEGRPALSVFQAGLAFGASGKPPFGASKTSICSPWAATLVFMYVFHVCRRRSLLPFEHVDFCLLVGNLSPQLLKLPYDCIIIRASTGQSGRGQGQEEAEAAVVDNSFMEAEFTKRAKEDSAAMKPLNSVLTIYINFTPNKNGRKANRHPRPVSLALTVLNYVTEPHMYLKILWFLVLLYIAT